MTDATSHLDFGRLFKLRLVVARHGEMDSAAWWNIKGILGRHGALALRRGFPSTHYFAQARIAFAVASSRCHEVFDPPGCMTLWTLPKVIPGPGIGGPTRTYPVVDLGKLELPEAPDLVRREPLVVDPPVNGVLRDAEVARDIFDGDPGVGRHTMLVVSGLRGPGTGPG